MSTWPTGWPLAFLLAGLLCGCHDGHDTHDTHDTHFHQARHGPAHVSAPDTNVSTSSPSVPARNGDWVSERRTAPEKRRVVVPAGSSAWLNRTNPVVTVQVDLPGSLMLGQSCPVDPPPFVGPRGSETVLLVEANDRLRWYAAAILRGQGYTVLEAKDGVEALRTAEQGKVTIALLVVNAELPPAGGVRLAEAMAGCQSQVRVLLLYRCGAAEAMCGGERYQALPVSFAPAELAQAVRDVLDRPPPEALPASCP